MLLHELAGDPHAVGTGGAGHVEAGGQVSHADTGHRGSDGEGMTLNQTAVSGEDVDCGRSRFVATHEELLTAVADAEAVGGVLTMIYRLMPTLIEMGKVYIAESPLYEISVTKTKRRGEKLFAYTDAEKDKMVAKLTEEGLSKERDEFEIKRSKGLGENQPEMMSLTTMHPATRRLIKVTPENVERTAAMFDVLLGDNLQSRKEYIAQNGGYYMEMLDLM